MKRLFKFLFGLVMIFSVPHISHAGQKVQISFDKYHGYTGTVDYLKAVNKAYPSITKLMEIGESSQGRPIYVLAITNSKTGTTMDREKELVYERLLEVPNPPITDLDLGKPGHLLIGAVHGDELTGNEVCLYFIDKMVSAYDSDEEITSLIDTKVFYVCPALNPDGLYNTVELSAPQLTNSMNQVEGVEKPVRKDLNKDGLFSQIRFKDPMGSWIKDSNDPRIMIKVALGEYPDAERYTVINEAEADKGIDVDRNFPEGWWLGDVMPDSEPGETLHDRMSGYRGNMYPGGEGDFPTSAPESQALCEFIINHPNVILSNDYQGMGGYVFRPMSSFGDKRMASGDVAVYDLVMGKEYLELVGAEVPEVWSNPSLLTKAKEELASSPNAFAAKRGYLFPEEWKSTYNEKGDVAVDNGLSMDWLYKQNGVYSILTKLWNPATDISGLEGLEGAELESAYVDYLEENGSKLFLDWEPAKDSEHGDVEVGGWVGNVGYKNPLPGEILESICERQFEYDIFRSDLMPQLQINDIEVEKMTSGKTTILNITAEVENVGGLATNLQGAASLPLNRGDVVWLIGENNSLEFLNGDPCQKVGTLAGTLSVPGVMGSNNKATVKWQVVVGSNEKVKVVASSLKGGTIAKEVNY